MKKFVLFTFISFLSFSLMVQAIPPGSEEEEKAKSPQTPKKSELVSQKLPEEEKKERKKLIEELSALSVSFRNTLKILQAKIFGIHKEKEKFPLQNKKKEKPDLNFELSGPINSNIQEMKAEDVLERFRNETRLSEVSLELMQKKLASDPKKEKKYGEAMKQLGSFYAEIRALYAKITRPETREIENPIIPRGPNGEVISDDLFTSGQKTGTNKFPSGHSLIEELKQVQALIKKQRELGQFIREKTQEEESFSSKSAIPSFSNVSSSESSNESTLHKPRVQSMPIPPSTSVGGIRNTRSPSVSPPSKKTLKKSIKKLKKSPRSLSFSSIQEKEREGREGKTPKTMLKSFFSGHKKKSQIRKPD